MTQLSPDPPPTTLAVKYRTLYVPKVSSIKESRANRWPDSVEAMSGACGASINAFAPRGGAQLPTQHKCPDVSCPIRHRKGNSFPHARSHPHLDHH